MEEEKTHILHNGRLQGAALLTLLVLAVFLFAQSFSTFREYRYIGSGIAPTNTINVTGEGKLFVRPDVALFHITITEEGATASEAQTAVAEKESQVLSAIDEQGIKEEDIRTTAYRLEPKYEQQCSTVLRQRVCENEQVGFTLSETLEVKVHADDDADFGNSLGQLVTEVSAAGVSNIRGPEFTVDDREEVLDEVRKIAIDDAKDKAGRLADELDVTLVRIVSFSENVPNFFEPRAFAANIASDQAETTIAQIPVGQDELSTQVYITYEIR